MNTFRITTLALLIAISLAACTDTSPTTSNSAGEPATAIGKAVKQATDEARKELATSNIDLNTSGHPKAAITPTGEFLINGRQVEVNAEQKALLLEYRQHINAVAEAGISIGLEGADLAGKAVTEALKGVFTGNTDQIEKKIEAEAEGIKQSAMKLCERLPAMKVTQDALATALPEFKPYATMDQSDIDDCMSDNDGKYVASKDVGRAIGNAMKGDSGHDVKRDAAAEAEAASAQ